MDCLLIWIFNHYSIYILGLFAHMDFQPFRLGVWAWISNHLLGVWAWISNHYSIYILGLFAHMDFQPFLFDHVVFQPFRLIVDHPHGALCIKTCHSKNCAQQTIHMLGLSRTTSHDGSRGAAEATHAGAKNINGVQV